MKPVLSAGCALDIRLNRRRPPLNRSAVSWKSLLHAYDSLESDLAPLKRVSLLKLLGIVRLDRNDRPSFLTRQNWYLDCNPIRTVLMPPFKPRRFFFRSRIPKIEPKFIESLWSGNHWMHCTWFRIVFFCVFLCHCFGKKTHIPLLHAKLTLIFSKQISICDKKRRRSSKDYERRIESATCWTSTVRPALATLSWSSTWTTSRSVRTFWFPTPACTSRTRATAPVR